MMDGNVRLRLAMAQMRTEWGRRKRNLGHAAEMIAEAAAQRCSVVLLPECLDIGWTHPSARRLAEPIPGPSSDALARAARKHGVWAVAGLTERDGRRIYNSAVLISPEGDIILRHRKINELDIAHSCYSIGDRLGVAHTPLGTVGVNICADNWGDTLVLAYALGRMGARCILSPCAWAMPADHDNEKEPYGGPWREAYARVARAFDMPVVGVSNVGWLLGGPWKGRKCIGNSLAVGRDGKVLLMAPYGEDAEVLVPVELELTAMPAKGTAITGWLRSRGYDGP